MSNQSSSSNRNVSRRGRSRANRVNREDEAGENQQAAEAEAEDEQPEAEAEAVDEEFDLASVRTQMRMFQARLRAAEQGTDDAKRAWRTAVAALLAMVPPSGARRGARKKEDARDPLSEASPEQLRVAVQEFLTACPTANLSDWIDEIRSDRHPSLAWDLAVEPDADAEDKPADDQGGQDSEADSSDDEEVPQPRLQPQPAPSSSSSSSSAAVALPAANSSSAPCKFSFDDYLRMSNKAEMMGLACVDPSCSLLRREHRKAQSDHASFKMPSGDCFPKFRDPKDKLMHDPHEFLLQLERRMTFHGVPANRFGIVLVSCLPDRLMQDWVEANIVATCHTWDEMKHRFKGKYDDPEIKERLIAQLEECTQKMSERAHQYTERFQSLVVRISGGAPIDTQMNIISCERGFIPDMRKELAKYRSMQMQQQGRPFEFQTLNQLYETAATLERGLAPRLGRVGKVAAVDRKRRRTTGSAEVNHVAGAAAAASEQPAVNKIELNEQGQPTNVNKKQRKSPRQRASAPVRGGAAMRGGRGGGRQQGGGGSAPSAPARGGAVQRGGRGGASSAAGTTPFTGTCFGCGQRGHRQSDCPRRASGGAAH